MECYGCLCSSSYAPYSLPILPEITGTLNSKDGILTRAPPVLCECAGLLPPCCLALARSLSLSWWRTDELSSPSLRSGRPSRCKTGRRRLLVCTQANGPYATYMATVTYLRLSHSACSNRLAGAGILGSKDRCLSSLFVLHFKHFCGCLLSKGMCISSLSLCLPLVPPVWHCSETCQF